MGSLYLNRLKRDEYEQLKHDLWDAQRGQCFICEQPIDLVLHGDDSDVDHVMPLTTGGRDDPANFALTHNSCNRSKQASDLRVARILARFQRLQSESGNQPTHPNLSDVLAISGGACYDLPIQLQDGKVYYSFPQIGDNDVHCSSLHHDKLSGMDYFFAILPIAFIQHDERINPRAIAAGSLRRLVEEFQAGLPQLHPALAWIDLSDAESRVPVQVFDGQHKAAAQVFLGATELPLRIFVNPDLDKLLTANTHAGTTLRQVAFDKSVQRRLGSQLFHDRVERYLNDRDQSPDYRGFSEQDLLDHFRGQRAEVMRYILDDVRDAITHHPDNRLKSFIDFGGRAHEKPLSYSTVERTFYSFFIYQKSLNTPLDYREEEGENPRRLEEEQILRLMNIVADTIFVRKYDPTIGTYKLEKNRVQQGELIPQDHLRAYRMAKEEIIYNWLGFVKEIIRNHFFYTGVALDEERLFQQRFPAPLWEQIERFVANLANLPVWINLALSETVFGGKQNYDFWKQVFLTGRTPSGQPVLIGPLNLRELSS